MAERSRHPVRNQRVAAGLIPGGDINFNFEFFACSLANEIKHDHSHVVIVVLDPRHD